MNKAVMISIQPKWCELIASGKKTIEVRKSEPKLDIPFQVYIYQTKKKWIYRLLKKLGLYKGKVIGEFVCDKVNNILYDDIDGNNMPLEKLLKKSCLQYKELCEYGNSKDLYKDLYAWHISQLKIYDKPKKLSEFKRLIKCKDWYNGMSGCEDVCGCYENGWCINGIRKDIQTRPPQSWCYVEELEE